MKKIIPLIVIGMMMMSVGAQAMTALNVLGGATMSAPSQTDTTNTSKTGITYGATLDLPLGMTTALEIGALSVGEKWDTGSAVISARALEIPALIRFTALPFLDFGIGGYYQSFSSTYSSTDDITGTETTGINWTASGAKSSDIGAKASVRLLLPLTVMTKFVIDGNYKYGISNISSSDLSSFKTRELAVLAGFSFGF